MAHANLCCSRKRGITLAMALLTLAGCAGQSALLGEGLRLSILEPPKEVRVVTSADAVVLKPSVIETASTRTVITPVAAVPARLPAWCEYLTEDTAAQTTIMRSPRLQGSTADDGKSSVSLGVSLSDFAKANVMEETAEARCRRYMAESGLQKLVFLSPQGLTGAGFRAKAKAVGDHKADIQALRRRVSQAMADGDLDREKATALMGMADQILTEGANAKSQADRRTSDLLGAKDHASILGRELLRAEADLEELNSRMRTFDAIDVSMSAGWSDDVTRDNFSVDRNGFSGKISVSMKLGAALPQRFEHEERAKQAKLRAISEEGGTLWQVNALRLAHERAIEGLVESSSKIDNAIAETHKLLAALKGVEAPEFQAPGIQARFRLIQLETDKAAVQGSIAEIRANMKRLKANG
jgi:hypothetical protein